MQAPLLISQQLQALKLLVHLIPFGKLVEAHMPAVLVGARSPRAARA
jgi:hypothetical protein